MSATITTQLGEALPPGQKHAITFHLPKWTNVLRMVNKDRSIIAQLKSFYPRMMPGHVDVKALSVEVLKFLQVPEGNTTFIFTSLVSAAECIDFAVKGPRVDDENLPAIAEGPETQPMPREELSLRVLEVEKTGQRLYAVIFSMAKMPRLMHFWANAGTGITTRVAEESLPHVDSLREIPIDSPAREIPESPAHLEIKERIATLLERSPVGGERSVKVTKDDIYLYQTGMTAIYKTHKYILSTHTPPQKSALFGFAFYATLRVFSDFGPGYKLYPFGTADDLTSLTQFLESEKEAGRHVQAIWAEFPTNPSLTVPSLPRLREIANTYNALLIIDDTVGSFANIDLLGSNGVDILVTSLTKSFSGYADVMGGSAVLNPLGSRYQELKTLYTANYTLDYSPLDASVLASNSRDYLVRSHTLNTNTQSLVSYFQTHAQSPSSPIKTVQHPTTNPEFKANYDLVKRPTTEEFAAGYGYLFSIVFKNVDMLRVFYDNLNMHMGPHLGAHRTIVITYVKALYGKDLGWAGGRGLSEASMRIAPGLEDVDALIGDFENALKAVTDQDGKTEGDVEKALEGGLVSL